MSFGRPGGEGYEVPSGTRRVARRPAAPPPRPTGTGRNRPRAGRLLAAGTVALLLVLAVVFGFMLFQPFAGKGSGAVAVRIPAGSSAAEIGQILEQRGVVSSSFFFKLRARLSGQRSKLRSGSFILRRGMSYAAAIDALTTIPPPPRLVRVTLPEGLGRREVDALVRGKGLTGSYLAESKRSPALSPRAYGAPARMPTLEGFLFPATYDLRPRAAARTLVDKQLAAFKRNFGQVDLSLARRRRLTPYDVVVIASMVEREVQRDDERALVAGVIYNRLRDGIPLGIDATLRYALGDWTRPLTKSQLALPTPYNTRLNRGLPPTPIGNPGLASLRAAARPASTPYLYYVVKPGTCGRHAFSRTNAQFLADVARYQSARAQAGGRSPTTCRQ